MERKTRRPQTRRPAARAGKPEPTTKKKPATKTEPRGKAAAPRAGAKPKPARAARKPAPTGAGEGIRLHVLLAHAGVASRREAERLIAAGEVQVNGKVVTEPGARAREGVDHVRVSGRLLHGPLEPRYYAYHKPVGCVSTLSDPEGRFCIGDVVEALRVRGLHPVGRLDFHSSGLLILTNDGALTEGLTHPRYHVEKRYAVKVSPRPSREAVEELRAGVKLRGVRYAPAFVREIRHADDKSWFDVRIAEGRNQQVRRMFEAVGARVEKLRRDAVGPLTLGSLQVGDARPLTAGEVKALQEAIAEARSPRTIAPARERRTTPRPRVRR